MAEKRLDNRTAETKRNNLASCFDNNETLFVCCVALDDRDDDSPSSVLARLKQRNSEMFRRPAKKKFQKFLLAAIECGKKFVTFISLLLRLPLRLAYTKFVVLLTAAVLASTKATVNSRVNQKRIKP